MPAHILFPYTRGHPACCSIWVEEGGMYSCHVPGAFGGWWANPAALNLGMKTWGTVRDVGPYIAGKTSLQPTTDWLSRLIHKGKGTLIDNSSTDDWRICSTTLMDKPKRRTISPLGRKLHNLSCDATKAAALPPWIRLLPGKPYKFSVK